MVVVKFLPDLEFSLICLLQDRERLSKLLTWVVPAALQPSFMQRSLAGDPDPSMLTSLKEWCREELLVSKLLRWFSASIILGSIADKFSKTYKFLSSTENKTLWPLLEDIIGKEREIGGNYSSSYKALATLLLYLQQLAGTGSNFLPSVTLALCLLLLGNPTLYT